MCHNNQYTYNYVITLYVQNIFWLYVTDESREYFINAVIILRLNKIGNTKAGGNLAPYKGRANKPLKALRRY